MENIYFVVEGQHDIAAIGKILIECGFHIVQKEIDLDKYWTRMIPRTYPFDGNIIKRSSHPTFFQNTDFSIAIHSAGSNSQLVNTMRINLVNLDFSQLRGIGIFIDSDHLNPDTVLQQLLSEVNKIPDKNIITLFNGIKPGKIQNINNCKTGVYIFPDNESLGTLENVLLFGAKQSYGDLLTNAEQYVDSIDVSYTQNNWTASSRNKVIVGCIANVLRPGKANQVSIQDNDWLCKNNLQINPIDKLYKFIQSYIS